jgi:Tol biopolymer transport system component
MKNKTFLTKIAGLVLVIGISLSGCQNLIGSDTGKNTGTNTGASTGTNTGTNGETSTETNPEAPPEEPEESGGRIYFIELDSESETSGTLSYIRSNSSVVEQVSGKTITSYSINREKTKAAFAEVISGYSGAYIAVMNIDGSGYLQTNVRGDNPCFGSDGASVYFDDGGELYSMNIDGTGKQLLTIPEVSGTKKFPRISPDGSKLAFYQTSPGYKWYYDDVVYLYIYDFATDRAIKLNNTSIPVSHLTWNSDGSTIAFSTTTGVTPPIHELWTVKADGSDELVKIAESGSPATGACAFPSFTADGSLLCSSTKNKVLNWRSDWDGSHYKYELARINADGTSLEILLPGTSVKDPVWVEK